MGERPVALITGAGGGIGRATALAFAAKGWDLVLSDFATEGLGAIAQQLNETGTGTTYRLVAGDVTTTEVRQELITAVDQVGRLDALVNNAGIISGLSLEETTEGVFDHLMSVNVKAQFFLVQAMLPALRASKGSVVNLSSTAGLVGFPSMPAYVASKTACVGLTRALALDLAGDGIRVNAVCPATIDTPMPRAYLATVAEEEREQAEQAFFARNLIKRFGTAEEVAGAIVYLASPEASFITGVAMPVDGGVTAW